MEINTQNEWHKALELLKDLMHEHYQTKIRELKVDLSNICQYVSMREFDTNVLRDMIEQVKIDHKL